MNKKEGGYLPLIGLTVFVIFAWGIVPALAQFVKMPGGVTSALVNAFAALAIIGIMLMRKSERQQLGQLKKYWKNFAILAFFWPFLYSVAYFQAIYDSNGSLVAIANYMWPLFAIGIWRARGVHVSPRTVISVCIACAAVAIVLFLDKSVVEFGVPILLGLIAGLLQGYFNVETQDGEKYPMALILQLTLVGALVTMIGGAAIALIFQSEYLPAITWNAVWPLVIIGAISNGLGFTAFLWANKLTGIGSKSEQESKKMVFLLLMSLVPFAQVILALIGQAEFKLSYLIGAVVVIVMLFVTKDVGKDAVESSAEASIGD